MQHERRRDLVHKGILDGVEVSGALGQHQYLAALRERLPDLSCDGIGALPVTGQMPENVLDPGFGWQVDFREA